MMAKPTPGPWTAERHGSVFAQMNGRSRQVASILGDAPQYGPADVAPDLIRDANARLCAAAPELLEALQTALAQCPDHDIDECERFKEPRDMWPDWRAGCTCFIARGLAAIAKATGEVP